MLRQSFSFCLKLCCQRHASQLLLQNCRKDFANTFPMIQASGYSYKSHISIDNIYPNSNSDFLSRKESHYHQDSSTPSENFTGFIPVDELEITTTRSSGPGGQNVNKVNSKVEIRFHLQSATWIPDWVKSKLEEKEAGRITKDGYFVVRSDATRKQLLNRADCLDKIRQLVYKASSLPEAPTEEDMKKKEQRLEKAKAGILREKRLRSITKKSRSAQDF